MSGQTMPKTFTYSGGITTFSAPVGGEYQITAAGGQGGSGNQLQSGGLGAVTTGVFVLGTGASLRIVAGGMGGNAPESALKLGGGGGGGSFVFETFNGYFSSNLLLEIAGGGGGAGGYTGYISAYPEPSDAINASIVPAGNDGDRSEGSKGSAGGTNGNGGQPGAGPHGFLAYGGGGGGV